MPHPLIALLTDFGTQDHYVGVMKGVMKSICPGAEFIDITHHIPAQDVRAAAFTLMNAYTYFPASTVFLVVVDPGVGTPRKPVAVQKEGRRFIAPDNGVLSYTLKQLDGDLSAAEIDINRYGLSTTHSTTFHGRDIFAPAAAHLANGVTVSEIGPTMQALKPLPMPQMHIDSEQVRGEVVYVDHFGNLVTSIGICRWTPNGTIQLDTHSQPIVPDATVTLKRTIVGPISRTYGDIPTGQALALIGSSGYLEVAVNQGSAAEHFNAKPGDPITLTLNEASQ